MFRREYVVVVATAALALVQTALAIGCSSSSTISPSPSSSAGGATIRGTVETTGAQSFRSLRSLQAVNSPSPTITVSVVGTGISATVASGESFTLNGVPTGNAVLQITGTGISAQITIPAIQNGEQIRVTVRVTDSSASITISERTAPTTDGNQAKVRGSIDSITPPSTMVVDGVTVSVPTGVPITNGNHSLTFADLKKGDSVRVAGNFSGAVLVATKVVVSDDNNQGNGGSGDKDDGHGNGHGEGHDDHQH